MISPNNVYLGDCYELIKEIPDKSVDCIYTDIPYLIALHGHSNSELGKRIKKVDGELKGDGAKQKWQEEADMYLDLMRKETDPLLKEKYHCLRSNLLNMLNYADISSGIDYKIFDDYIRVMKKMNIFIWCSKMQILDILNYFSKYGTYEILVWCKTNCVPATNNVWLPNVEYCLYFREKGVRLNDGYDLKSRWYLSSTNKEDKDKYTHPTIKPIDLVKNHILHTTKENDVVLDTFMGSGTTCKACQETNRQYIGFEINEQYYNIAKDRLNNINAKGEVSLF